LQNRAWPIADICASLTAGLITGLRKADALRQDHAEVDRTILGTAIQILRIAAAYVTEHGWTVYEIDDQAPNRSLDTSLAAFMIRIADSLARLLDGSR
jgi:hypothetical protein